MTVCRRHRLWTGPAARTHDGQLDISRVPEILRAQRWHHYLAQAHHQPWQPGDAIHDATNTIRGALHHGHWTPQQAERLRQLDPAT